MNLVERAGRMVKHPRLTASGVGEHFYVIDLMRGLAAIAILVWHYQHFFFPQAETRLPVTSRQIQPLYSALMPLYEYGSYAVQLFWMISGFVFCAVYAHTKATTRDFVVNRFARLYPLHIITLLLVAALQVISAYRLGHCRYIPTTMPIILFCRFSLRQIGAFKVVTASTGPSGRYRSK